MPRLVPVDTTIEEVTLVVAIIIEVVQRVEVIRPLAHGIEIHRKVALGAIVEAGALALVQAQEALAAHQVHQVGVAGVATLEVVVLRDVLGKEQPRHFY